MLIYLGTNDALKSLVMRYNDEKAKLQRRGLTEQGFLELTRLMDEIIFLSGKQARDWLNENQGNIKAELDFIKGLTQSFNEALRAIIPYSSSSNSMALVEYKPQNTALITSFAVWLVKMFTDVNDYFNRQIEELERIKKLELLESCDKIIASHVKPSKVERLPGDDDEALELMLACEERYNNTNEDDDDDDLINELLACTNEQALTVKPRP